MAWKNFNDDSSEEKQLMYDLRTIYAEKIIGETLRHIAIARKNQDFPSWYKLLKRDLRTEISKNLKQDEMEMVNERVEEVKKIISENSEAYLKKSKNAEQYDLVEEELIQFEMLLLRLMERHKMFGAKEEPEPL